MRGKSIKLYIMGDQYKNLKTAELSNWTGKAYLGDRKHISVLRSIDETSVPGMYVLISEQEESFQKKIYIGEADDISERLEKHLKTKDWWENFVVFISKDSNLTKSHVRYLEKALYNIALDNYTTLDLDNNNTPPGSKLSQSDRDDMEEYKDNMVFVLKNLGVLDFTRLKSTSNLQTKEDLIKDKTGNNVFLINIPVKGVEKGTYKARMIVTEDGYRVLSGSYFKKTINRTSSHNYIVLRDKLIARGVFEEDVNTDCFKLLEEDVNTDCFKLLEDVDFESPSAAAAVVRNTSLNGRKEWKTQTGMTLDEYENTDSNNQH